MTMRMPTAVKTQTRPINVNTGPAYPIIPYRSPSNGLGSPQVINPVPRGTNSSPLPAPLPTPKSPDIIDAEIIKSKPPVNPSSGSRRPVVDRDARPSSESTSPQSYPRYPDPSDGWKSNADFIAWQNGESRERLDSERAAYEFTKEWGKTGGMLYPYTENGPRTPIISENFTLANRFRARHGLPSIDRYGYEKAIPLNPSLQPSRGFQSNPFKTTLPNDDTVPGTPSNFNESPYNFDIDPDTGKPYTDLQKRRGEELGRPAWHIDPTTGNPWGKDEEGTPFPNPFPGYPGAAVRYPTDNRSLNVVSVTYTFEAGAGPGVPDSYSPWRASVTLAPGGSISQAAGGPGITNAFIGGVLVAQWGDASTIGMTPTFRIVSLTPNFEVSDPSGSPDVEMTPLGNPQAPPSQRVSPEYSPVQDPRVNPTTPRTQPGTQPRPLNDSPYTQPQLPQPAPSPGFQPLQRTPNQPNYAPSPQPYPRLGPNGKPQPANDPQNQPLPARPQNPSATTTTDRPSKPPVNPDPSRGKCNPCPDPCPEEEMTTISYKEFIGCNVTPSGAPDRFRTKSIAVPKNSSLAIKSLLDSVADIKAQECSPCCYWDIKTGPQTTLYIGIPSIIGQDIPITKGIANVVITYNATDALSDNTVRNLKRIANSGEPENTFCNVAVVWLIDANGNAISNTEIWVVGTTIAVPLSYRDQNLRVRILPKSAKVNFSVVDSGDRWVQKTE